MSGGRGEGQGFVMPPAWAALRLGDAWFLGGLVGWLTGWLAGRLAAWLDACMFASLPAALLARQLASLWAWQSLCTAPAWHPCGGRVLPVG